MILIKIKTLKKDEEKEGNSGKRGGEGMREERKKE